MLHWIPRYRQKLSWVPVDHWPVWIDDRHFDLRYHIRHVSLPRPGTLDQLKELAARILARRLDPSRPLWEIWVIEGLEGGQVTEDRTIYGTRPALYHPPTVPLH